MNPASRGVAGERVGPHHGPRAHRGLVGEPVTEAAHQRVAVEQLLDLGRRRAEPVLGALVHDHDHAVVGDHPPHGGQHRRGVGHVVDALEREHRVVRPDPLVVEGADVGGVEREPVAHPGLGRVAVCRRDRRRVDVVPVDRRALVAAGEPDGRPPVAAADVGDPRRPLQPGVHLGGRRQQILDEAVEEQGSVGTRLRLARLVAEVVPAQAGAGAVGVGDAVDEPARGGGEPRDRGHERGAVGIDQHRGVRGRQREPPLGRLGRLVVDGEDAARGLVLEPLAGVPLGAVGAGGELDRRRGAVGGQRAVPAEAVAEVDGLDELGTEHGAEDPLGERVGGGCGSGVPRGGVVRHRHAPIRPAIGCTAVARWLAGRSGRVAQSSIGGRVARGSSSCAQVTR